MILAALLAFLLSSPVLAQTPSQQEKVIDVNNLKDCGLITRYSPDLINPNCFQQFNNVSVDQNGLLTRRTGYTAYNSSPCGTGQSVRGMWPFFATSGSRYLVVLSSGSMYYTNGDGTCNPISGLGGLSLTATMECVQTLGYLWCTDGTDPVFETNVTSTATVVQAPLGRHIGAFRNRILISGVAGSDTDLYLSGELNGFDYTLPTAAVLFTTSPAIINVSGINDGQAVTCLMGEYQNQFLVGRSYDLYALSGYSLADFTLRKISSQVGCLEPRSVQEVNNVLYWLSNRGVEGYTGTQINRVSYPIDPTILPIIQSAPNPISFTLTSQADWQSGNLTASGRGAPMSATISPGDVVPSTWGVVETSPTVNGSAGWGGKFTDPNGVFGTVIISSVTGYLTVVSSVPIIPAYFTNSDFESGPGFGSVSGAMQNINFWTCSVAGQGDCLITGVSPIYGTWSGSIGAYNTSDSAPIGGSVQYDQINILDQFNHVLVSSTVDSNSSNINQNVACSSQAISTVTLTIPFQQPVRVQFLTYRGFSALGPITVSLTSNLFVPSAPNLSVSYEVVPDSTTGPTGNCYRNDFPNNTSPPTPIYASSSGCFCRIDRPNAQLATSPGTGYYTSPVFDTSFSTPTGGTFAANSDITTSNSISFFVRQATSTSGVWNSTQSVTNGSTLNLNEEFYQYWDVFNITDPTQLSQPYDVSLVALNAATTGYYITPCILVSSPPAWGYFNADAVTGGGSLNFWISTGPTCASATALNAPWTPATPGTIMPVTTNTEYIASRVLFNFPAGVTTPVLNDMTFAWNTGSLRPPTASAMYDDRYFLFFTTGTAASSVNDHVLIYDQNQKWELWDDIYAGAATLYLNQLYTGDSKASGTIYTLNSGQSDNSGPYTMSFQTADFDDSDPNMIKEFHRAYIMLSAPNNGNSAASLSCNYAIDGSTLTYSLGTVTLSESPENSGYFVAKLPFPLSQPLDAHWINLFCSYTGTTGPVAVHRIRLVYSPINWD